LAYRTKVPSSGSQVVMYLVVSASAGETVKGQLSKRSIGYQSVPLVRGNWAGANHRLAWDQGL